MKHPRRTVRHALRAVCAAAGMACGLSWSPAMAQVGSDGALALSPARAIDMDATVAPVLLAQVREGLYKALREHPEVAAAQANHQAKSFEVDAAKFARFPRFQVGSGAGTSDGAGGASSSYQVFSVSARMTLLDGGVLGARIDAAEAQSAALEAAVRATSQKVALDALTAYVEVLRFENKRAVAARAVQALGELVKLEQRRVVLGAVGESDLQLARSRRGAFAAKEQEFQSKLVEAAAKFETYFGFQPDPSRLPALELPAHWAPASQVALMQTAQSLSAELAEAQGRIDTARAQVRQYEAARFPSVDLVVARTRDPRGVVYADATRSGVELNWNFGNGFERQLRVKTALAEVANQEARFDSARLNLLQLTSTAWGQSRASQEKVEAMAEALRESGQLVQGRERMLGFGRTTLASVLDARVEYETQMLDGVDAMADLRVGQLRMARVSGRLLLDARTGPSWVEEVFAVQRVGLMPAVEAEPPLPSVSSRLAAVGGGESQALRLQASWSLKR